MGTLFGMILFSAAGALTADRVYSWATSNSTSAVAEVGRFATFTGTWTTITAASSMKGLSKSTSRLRGRIRGIRNFTGRAKE